MRPSNAALTPLMPDAEARYVPQLGHGWMNRKPQLHRRAVAAWLTGSELPDELRPETTPWPRSRVYRALGRVPAADRWTVRGAGSGRRARRVHTRAVRRERPGESPSPSVDDGSDPTER